MKWIVKTKISGQEIERSLFLESEENNRTDKISKIAKVISEETKVPENEIAKIISEEWNRTTEQLRKHEISYYDRYLNTFISRSDSIDEQKQKLKIILNEFNKFVRRVNDRTHELKRQHDKLKDWLIHKFVFDMRKNRFVPLTE